MINIATGYIFTAAIGSHDWPAFWIFDAFDEK